MRVSFRTRRCELAICGRVLSSWSSTPSACVRSARYARNTTKRGTISAPSQPRLNLVLDIRGTLFARSMVLFNIFNVHCPSISVSVCYIMSRCQQKASAARGGFRFGGSYER
jgi:hypothetical protein